jgi:hypothetical protein
MVLVFHVKHRLKTAEWKKIHGLQKQEYAREED